MGKRFLFPTIALLVVLLSALGGVVVWQGASFGSSMISARAESMTDFLAKVGKTHVSYFNLQELDNLVDQAMKDKDIKYVVFLDDKGKVLTQKAEFPTEPADDPTLYKYTREFTDADNRPMGSMRLVLQPPERRGEHPRQRAGGDRRGRAHPGVVRARHGAAHPQHLEAHSRAHPRHQRGGGAR